MAHQSHNIPWTNVTSNLKWRVSNPCKDGATDLHLQGKADQSKKFQYFAVAFVRNINQHADSSRRQYPAKHNPPQPDEIVIDDNVTRKITPSVRNHYWNWNRHHRVDRNQCTRSGWATYTCNVGAGGLCRGEHGDVFCGCVIPYSERKMAAFLRRSHLQDRSTICLEDGVEDGMYNSEMVQILLLYGEMNVLFRVCAHPDNDIQYWWDKKLFRLDDLVGWDRIATMALKAYILLNVIYSLPDLWGSPLPKLKDYRRTRVYQNLVWRLVAEQWSDPVTYPHRQFFGITYGEVVKYPTNPKMLRTYMEIHRCGKTSYGKFLKSFQSRKKVANPPSLQEVSYIRWMLCRQGLPHEIAQQILNYAGFNGQRRLPVAHDPFHRENWTALTSYLAYCWKLLVRCELLARAASVNVDWEQLVVEALVQLFSCSCGPKLYDMVSADDGTSTRRYELVR